MDWYIYICMEDISHLNHPHLILAILKVVVYLIAPGVNDPSMDCLCLSVFLQSQASYFLHTCNIIA